MLRQAARANGVVGWSVCSASRDAARVSGRQMRRHYDFDAPNPNQKKIDEMEKQIYSDEGRKGGRVLWRDYSPYDPEFSYYYPHFYKGGSLYDVPDTMDDVPIGKTVLTHDSLLEKKMELWNKTDQVEQMLEEHGEWRSDLDWKPTESVRTGTIAIHVGRVPFFDKFGNKWMCTALWMPNLEVVRLKTLDKDGYWGMMLACGYKDRMTKSMERICSHPDVSLPKHAVKTFRVTEDAMLPIGHMIEPRHYLPGQWVHLTTALRPRGRQGVLSRWGIGGGFIKSHWLRKVGSVSAEGEKKVARGRKAAGNVAGLKTVKRRVWAVDPKNKLVYVHGHIPGCPGFYCTMKDYPYPESVPGKLPFPTFRPDDGEDLTDVDLKDCILQAKTPSKGMEDWWVPQDEEGFEEFRVKKRKWGN